jgi:hypothetical protein
VRSSSLLARRCFTEAINRMGSISPDGGPRAYPESP